MKIITTTYIALGSNQGEKMDWLKKAVYEVYKAIGDVTRVSKVYKTPAWGFEGDDFLNAVIEVNTRFSAEVTLEKLLTIELQLGRIRVENIGYQARTIDLDILFYGNETIVSERLTVPHPKLIERSFVLYPLADLVPNLIHPTLNKSVSELINNCKDTSPIEAISDQLQHKKAEFRQVNYLTIEGNIGSGKTSLAEMIAEDFNGKLILERFKDNPFLPKFYEDQARFAFPLEMSFLADRHQQLMDDISQLDLFSDFAISDYNPNKSLIFSKVTLQEDEYALYKKIFDIMYSEVPKPDVYVYLYQNIERLLRNIKKRGREYEQNITPDYLKRIHDGYLNFFKSQNKIDVKVIDISDLDFVANREDYLYLIEKISEINTKSLR
ncbi:2-amino-4-hydroxy-6-hydroxymethyldihydropteridine diphosphokinase [Psychroflexus montanilacus]|uniref:2-amino-4-hydroxy-6- hydroxymethyldihydropteridine diphosphokinase n=1 Tax=Psychroflexus montanilacus TaxID=2873598 RepID=UPI001CCBCA1E|nr:2-amino-4-hydroxy-6-hydroxymethyldihydropteridine diphosphokinase [Psychroflexus montanilacus]MBZ9650593.1 2-amino-4-hydroxy-6-hydroxymethyldihydropteridine diphosphokinase [Psychroflexus montanilacus]